MPPWVISFAIGILGTSGIVGLLGLVVQRQNNRNINTATLVGLAMDGLKQTNADLKAQIADLKSYIEVLEQERRGDVQHKSKRRPIN